MILSKPKQLEEKYIITNKVNKILNTQHKNIKLCIDEKVCKIDKSEFNFNNCTEWWLVLVDYIVYGMDDADFKALSSLNIDKNKFSKVIILSYGKDSVSYEL